MPDNLRHAQYLPNGTQIDDPQNTRDFTDTQIQALVSGGEIGPTTATYQRTRRALAGVRAGTRRMRVGILGDSRTWGFGGSATNSGWGNLQPNNWATRFAALLTARGFTAYDAAFTGWHGVNPTYTATDPRITFGAGWGGIGSGSLGGACYFFPNGGGTAQMVMAPGFNTTNARLWYVAGSGNGSVTMGYDATTLGSINTSGGGTLGRQDYSFAAGSHTIFLTPQNAQLNLCAVEVWNTAAPHVSVLNFAVCGALASSFQQAPNAWAPFPMIAKVSDVEPVDLWIICLDANDSNNNTSPAAYEASLTALVAQCKAGGTAGASDVLLIGSPNCGNYEIQRPTYIAIGKRVAAAAGIRYLSLAEKWGAFQPNWDAGIMFDQVHENAPGYELWANNIADTVLAL